VYDAGEGRGGGGGRREQPGPEAEQARQQALHDVSQVENLFLQTFADWTEEYLLGFSYGYSF
jgi:hypothetical protein